MKLSVLSVGAFVLVTGATSFSELCNVVSGIDVAPLPVTVNRAGTQLTADFTMDAEFSSKNPYQCGCCEYRQSFRAVVSKFAFTVDGNPVDIQVVDPTDASKRISVNANPQTFVEDHRNYGRGGVRYGHRGEAQSADESYTNGGTGPGAATPNRANGCHYHGHDAPGFRNMASGHAYEINLIFRGEIVCVRPNCGPSTSPHRQKEWVVSMQKTQP
jgi:hypothetical protein